MSGTGGVLLAIDSSGPPAASTFVGMWLIGTGFCFVWQGVRVFYGKQPLWNVLAFIVAISAICVAMFEDRRAQNVVYASIQIVPIALAMLTLFFARPRQLGALVAAGAIFIAFAGHAGEIGTNLARLAGYMSTERYYDFAAWFLVAAIIGGSIWNLGFLLMAIDHLRADLATLASKDDLTRLPNRRGFRERARLYERTGRQRRTGAAVMMIDLDNFKTINDQYGHAAGDACLVHMVSIADSMRRRSDFLARLSGDEFCLLLPDTNVQQAAAMAERLTRAVASSPLEWRGHLISLSISVGLSEWRPDTDDEISDALIDADAALYWTKSAGRNGYTIYAGEEGPSVNGGGSIKTRA
ncbi:GGDEF domain-containing protein [Chelativorans sp. YIM 93263]|uniref:GGDEF domain-containing protein n=1 Tax=Chelativorans sp. YIM 93263 TaxID=2906648 RepID=UPI0023790B73|nr:GGDEF domain-containing protein [Chelativorans sp. YIM 93263]